MGQFVWRLPGGKKSGWKRHRIHPWPKLGNMPTASCFCGRNTLLWCWNAVGNSCIWEEKQSSCYASLLDSQAATCHLVYCTFQKIRKSLRQSRKSDPGEKDRTCDGKEVLEGKVKGSGPSAERGKRKWWRTTVCKHVRCLAEGYWSCVTWVCGGQDQKTQMEIRAADKLSDGFLASADQGQAPPQWCSGPSGVPAASHCEPALDAASAPALNVFHTFPLVAATGNLF